MIKRDAVPARAARWAVMSRYDFRLNPTNPHTRGIRPAETCPEQGRRIRRLFPNCAIELHKITLAPPLTRLVVKVSWMPALFLESLKVFNTHYLALIRPE